MFICVSLNPAVDKRLELPALIHGSVIRARAAHSFPGGKSTHVAMVLRTLGELPQWVGPCGGPTGGQLIAGLSALGIDAYPCHTEQHTRTNLEVIEDDGTVTEILEPGSAPSSAEFAELEKTCGHLFAKSKSTSVIFSGSLPAGAPPEAFALLLALAHKSDCRTFLDVSGQPLRIALGTRPHFVKPNREEAAELLGENIDSLSSAVAGVKKLIGLGARSAAISMGAEGLLYCPGESSSILFAPGISLQPNSTVGCGDAAMAGFARAVTSNSSPEEAIRLAAACATANCLAESPGAANLDNIQKFLSQVQVKALS
jgi:1-phosphofructokinase family hexose kinase